MIMFSSKEWRKQIWGGVVRVAGSSLWLLAGPRIGICPVILYLLFLNTGTIARAAEMERPFRVLLVHSFGTSAPPFTTHSTAFESTLKRELGTTVDLDEVSLDMARYAQPEMEEAFAEFLIKRCAKWQPDLVVPIGSPAGRFVAKFRDRLFPRTPVIYTGMDKRTLPAGAITNNATFVGEDFDLKALVEDILQLDPETNQIVVILGATPLERFWKNEFEKEFAPFAARVKFTWVNDLSFDQMLDLVSKLPAHSFVILGLLMRDAAGVSYNEDEALARLHAVSRAPINGLFQHEVGLGIVGGRLYQGELEGIKSGEIAARILRGESVENIPPLVIGMRTPTYDARELERWNFSESRLPPGSTVLFGQPTLWQQYRWQLIAGFAFIVLQAVLIFALLFQRRRRAAAELGYRHSQAEVLQKRAELAHVARVATLGELAATLTHELRQPLASILLESCRGGELLRSPEPSLPELRSVLGDIREVAEHAGGIIGNLRDMLKRGRVVSFATVDVNDIIRVVEHIARGDANLHRVIVELELSTEPLLVSGDSIQLQQVILNLMLNAFSAMSKREAGKRGRLFVRTKAEDTSHLLIEVQDNGTGIAPDQLESIFAPFVTSKPDGLGMGLSICRTIVESHGGKITAVNNQDRGATFRVVLPTIANGIAAATEVETAVY